MCVFKVHIFCTEYLVMIRLKIYLSCFLIYCLAVCFLYCFIYFFLFIYLFIYSFISIAMNVLYCYHEDAHRRNEWAMKLLLAERKKPDKPLTFTNCKQFCLERDLWEFFWNGQSYADSVLVRTEHPEKWTDTDI